MSLLRANCALNVQAIHSGVWHPLKIDKIEVPNGPEFRLQFFSEAVNERYRIALNKTRQKNSPFYGMADNNSLFHDFVKDCLIEFGLKDWRRVSKIDLMTDKEISDKTISFAKDLLLDANSLGLLENMVGKDGVLRKEGRNIYYDELAYILMEEKEEKEEKEHPFLLESSKFFEADVPCTQRNIKTFLNEPRNDLAFKFCEESVYIGRPFQSIMSLE